MEEILQGSAKKGSKQMKKALRNSFKEGGKQMKRMLHLTTLLAVCLMLVFTSISNVQADGSTPVEVPAEGDNGLSIDAATASEETASEGNDTVSSDVITTAPE